MYMNMCDLAGQTKARNAITFRRASHRQLALRRIHARSEVDQRAGHQRSSEVIRIHQSTSPSLRSRTSPGRWASDGHAPTAFVVPVTSMSRMERWTQFPLPPVPQCAPVIPPPLASLTAETVSWVLQMLRHETLPATPAG